MPRTGISYDDVEQVANHLAAAHSSINVDSVRMALGNTGSRTTINNHLKTWRQQQSQWRSNPSTLSSHLKSLVETVATQMVEDAKAPLLELQALHARTLAAKEQELSALNDTLVLKEQSFQVLNLQLQQAQSALALLQGQHQQLTTDNSVLAQRLIDKDALVGSLEKKYAQLQANLEHFREASERQRVSEKQSFEEQLAGVQQRLHQSQSALQVKEEALSQLKSQHQMLVSEHQHLEQLSVEREKKWLVLLQVEEKFLALEKEMLVLKESKEQLVERFREKQEQVALLDGNNLHLSNQLRDVREQLQQLRESLSAANATIHALKPGT